MQKPAAKNSRSFLQKFQGKKNAISRQGLLHLLDIKKQSIGDNKYNQLPKGPTREFKVQAATPALSEKIIEGRTNKAKSSQGGTNKSILLNEISDRYGRAREQLKQQRSVQFGQNKIKLPAINKSSSHANNIHKKNIETSSTQLVQVNANHRARSLPRRTESNQQQIISNLTKQIQLDKYALRHLQFLDKFQKQLINNQAVSKKTSRSQYH